MDGENHGKWKPLFFTWDDFGVFSHDFWVFSPSLALQETARKIHMFNQCLRSGTPHPPRSLTKIDTLGWIYPPPSNSGNEGLGWDSRT